jgi:TetR/AcrR family transcriptional regulator, transcriptional repressor for nem operon
MRVRGRPREFDLDQALDHAIRVFRARGYHATSIGDLSAATDLSAGSIYKAFKDKQAIFIAALDRYDSLRQKQLETAANGRESGLAKLRAVLMAYAALCCGEEGETGCMVVGAATGLSSLEPPIADKVRAGLEMRHTLLGTLLRQGQEDGSVRRDLDAQTATDMLLCLVLGMRVIGKTGRPASEMEAVVAISLASVAA